MEAKHLLFATALVLLLACSKDNGLVNQPDLMEQPDPKNQAPESFSLMNVAYGSVGTCNRTQPFPGMPLPTPMGTA